MKNELVVEIAPIRLAPHATEEDLVRGSDALQQSELGPDSGCLGRFLLKRTDAEYLDVVIWRSRDAANAMMEAAATSKACADYFACMVMGDDPAEGIEHLSVVKSYGALRP